MNTPWFGFLAEGMKNALFEAAMKPVIERFALESVQDVPTDRFAHVPPRVELSPGYGFLLWPQIKDNQGILHLSLVPVDPSEINPETNQVSQPRCQVTDCVLSARDPESAIETACRTGARFIMNHLRRRLGKRTLISIEFIEDRRFSDMYIEVSFTTIDEPAEREFPRPLIAPDIPISLDTFSGKASFIAFRQSYIHQEEHQIGSSGSFRAT